ncbi:MAG: hypothetical protein K0R47_3395 [Brevibacillus sp.]|nr:hypothetical protein [Brevibacillus sp.]
MIRKQRQQKYSDNTKGNLRLCFIFVCILLFMFCMYAFVVFFRFPSRFKKNFLQNGRKKGVLDPYTLSTRLLWRDGHKYSLLF